MNKFRKKPVEIEAVQISDEESFLAILEMTGEKARVLYREVEGEKVPYAVQIWTLEGVMAAGPGDWIIKGVKGEFYPCKPDIFEETYEAVTE